jgi:hypothetical protein
MKDHTKDVVAQVTGFLMAILLFLGTVNIHFDWFTEKSISAFGLLLGAAIALGINLYTIYQNHYGFTDKAKKEKSMIDDLNRPK